MAKILICGIYLADREHLARSEILELSRSARHHIVQRWVGLDITGTGDSSLPCTELVVRTRTPKFTLINQLISDVEEFDALIVCDDDVDFPGGFVDNFLELVFRHKLALSQPARTEDSFLDHFITTRIRGVDARRTRFVEIGPVTCITKSAFSVLLPFDLRSPMGWGLDFVWPCLIERASLRMGIVDATPVGHRLRKAMANYANEPVREEMARLLTECPSLTASEAFSVLESYA